MSTPIEESSDSDSEPEESSQPSSSYVPDQEKKTISTDTAIKYLDNMIAEMEEIHNRIGSKLQQIKQLGYTLSGVPEHQIDPLLQELEQRRQELVALENSFKILTDKKNAYFSYHLPPPDDNR